MTNNLRERVRRGDVVLGAFIKSASHQVAEVLGRASLDFAIIDAEHAPFGPTDIDRVVLGATSAGLPCLVRPPDHTPGFINQCLDLGAAGVVAPHVVDRSSAAAIVSAVRYDSGQRGFSPSTRAGGFGTVPSAAYRAQADQANMVWCQIEDAVALERLNEIATIDGVDCLFLGRADLALSLGIESQNDPVMRNAIVAIAEAARRNRVAFGLYLGDPSEIGPFRALGASIFVCGSDQSYLLAQGRAIRQVLTRVMVGESR